MDLVPERLERARPYCDDVIDIRSGDLVDRVLGQTDGRGADSVIDAVGMEAHGSPVAEFAQTAAGYLPSPVGRAVMRNAGMDGWPLCTPRSRWFVAAAPSPCPVCMAGPPTRST